MLPWLFLTFFMTMTMKVFGFQFYLDGELVAWSETFHLTAEAVREDMQRNVRKICQNIYDNQKEGSGFRWSDNFVPDDPASCYDEEEYNESLESYNRIKFMVGSGGNSQINEGVTDSPNELENNSPYEISWHIIPYKMEIPKLIFGQIIAIDAESAGEYRMPHLTAAYPDTPGSREQVIDDLAECLRGDIDDIDEDDFRTGLEKSGVLNWQNDHCGVITVYEANILITECKLPELDEDE
jgi:hypothetical protein